MFNCTISFLKNISVIQDCEDQSRDGGKTNETGRFCCITSDSSERYRIKLIEMRYRAQKKLISIISQ